LFSVEVLIEMGLRRRTKIYKKETKMLFLTNNSGYELEGDPKGFSLRKVLDRTGRSPVRVGEVIRGKTVSVENSRLSLIRDDGSCFTTSVIEYVTD
jgi:hypothetical protein